MSLPEWRERAATLIEQRGWCQGAYANGDGFCLAGAVFMAFGIEADLDAWTGEAEDAIDAVAGWLNPEWDDDRESVEVLADWNDNPERTRDEVIALLRGQAVAS